MATSRKFTALCVLWSTIRCQRFQPGTIPWCMVDLPGVQGPVFVFALYCMCFYFISASFRKHCIIISSWSQRRDYFKWLWVIVLEGPSGRALGTGESNITVRLLTVSWTKPLQSKKIQKHPSVQATNIRVTPFNLTFKYYIVSKQGRVCPN